MSTQVLTKIIADYFKTQPVLKAWLFGSYARGEETPESDARQTNYLKQRFPKITKTITSISFEYDESMVDTAAALELDEITGIAKALGGIETICTSN